MVLYGLSAISMPNVCLSAWLANDCEPPSVTGMLILKTLEHMHSKRGRGAADGPPDPKLPE